MIKKTITIGLFLLLMFNWFGFQIILSFYEQQTNRKLVEQLDKHEYQENDLISIRVPVTHFPYYSNSSAYERIDGRVDIGGFSYNFVKRRIFDDTIEFLCISNPAATRLGLKKIDFLKSVNGLPQTEQNEGSGNHPSGMRPFCSDFESLPDYPSLYNAPSTNCRYGDHLLSETEDSWPFIPDIPPEFS